MHYEGPFLKRWYARVVHICKCAPAWPIMGPKALCYILWNMCYLICFSGLPSSYLLGSKLAKMAKMAKIDSFKEKISQKLKNALKPLIFWQVSLSDYGLRQQRPYGDPQMILSYRGGSKLSKIGLEKHSKGRK